MSRPHVRVLGLIAAAAAIAVAVPIAAVSVQPTPLMPDLVSDPPTDPYFSTWEEALGEDQPQRLLLRFEGYVRNEGEGPLEMFGNPQMPTGHPDGMRQYFLKPGGDRWSSPGDPEGSDSWEPAPGPPPEVIYETADGHNHWHVQRIAEYSLWDATRTTKVGDARKVGFCLYDNERVGSDPESQYPVYSSAVTGGYCEQGNPGATSLREGVSAGWRDVYAGHLPFQWVDVSDVAPGTYHLASRADPENTVRESDESNNDYAFSAPLVVPGHLAQPVSAPPTPAGTPITIPLAAQAIAAPPEMKRPLGPRQFRIEVVPEGGVLRHAGQYLGNGATVPAGVDSIQYFPYPGFEGADSFRFSALDANSPYPVTPRQATASLLVTPTPVGAPTSPGADPTPAAAFACTLPSRPRSLSLRATAGQLRINQRIAIAAVRRLNAIRARLDGRPEPATPRGRPGRIGANTVQLRINQRISEAGYRRARDIYLQLGGTGAAPLTPLAPRIRFTRAGVGANQLTNIRALDMLNCINRNLD